MKKRYSVMLIPDEGECRTKTGFDRAHHALSSGEHEARVMFMQHADMNSIEVVVLDGRHALGGMFQIIKKRVTISTPTGADLRTNKTKGKK